MQRVYLKLDGRCVATLENGVLKRRSRASRHLLQKPPALCIDAGLYDAYRAQFHTLEFTDEESGRVYTISASVYDAKRFTIQRGGFPPQYACPLRYWHCHDPAAAQQQPQLALLEV